MTDRAATVIRQATIAMPDGVELAAWRGTAGTEYPWGSVVDEEYLRYEVHDERPAEASARCATGSAVNCAATAC